MKLLVLNWVKVNVHYMEENSPTYICKTTIAPHTMYKSGTIDVCALSINMFYITLKISRQFIILIPVSFWDHWRNAGFQSFVSFFISLRIFLIFVSYR